MLLLLIAICAAPALASYFVYYVVRPSGGQTNYGALIEPQRPIPAQLTVRGENRATWLLAELKGKWLMISVDGGACPQSCVTKLYFMRQVRVAQGAEQNRVLNVWLRTDAAVVPEAVRRAYVGTRMLQGNPETLAVWLPATATSADSDHIYVVDPNGNLMMRFPPHPDPSKIKNDLAKLLKWSGIG